MFRSAPCPLHAVKSTGWFGVTASRVWRLAPGSSSTRGPMVPRSQVPAGALPASLASKRTTSASSGSFDGAARSTPGPRPGPTCVWASLNPGTTTRPSSAITRAAGPAAARTSAAVPTAVMRSPVIARAW